MPKLVYGFLTSVLFCVLRQPLVAQGQSPAAGNDPFFDLRVAEQAAVESMSYPANISTKVTSSPILLYEDAPDCRHPAFYDSHLPDSGAFEVPGGCVYINVSWKQRVEAVPDAAYHPTCIASLLGARELPYDDRYLPYRSNSAVKLWTVKSKKLGDLQKLIEDYVAKEPLGKAVINISQTDPSEDSDKWKSIVSSAEKYDMVIVASAGNLIGTQPVLPASLAADSENVISVAALNRRGSDVWITAGSSTQGSTYGDHVDIAAPGEDIPCATHEQSPVAFYATTRGTSMAAALVSRVAAILLARGLTPLDVKGRLLSASDRFVGTRTGDQVRAGKLNVSNALRDTGKAHLVVATRNGDRREFDSELRPEKNQLLIKPDENAEYGDNVPVGAIGRIERITPVLGQDRYRVIYRFPRDKKTKKWKIENNARIEGCLLLQDKDKKDKYILTFGPGCGKNIASDEYLTTYTIIDYLGPISHADQ